MMQNKKYLLNSFTIAFLLTILSVIYFEYTQSNKRQAIEGIQKTFSMLSNLGVEVAYKDLNIIKNPSYIDFFTKETMFIGINNTFSAQDAKLTVNNNVGLQITLNDINTEKYTSISKAEITILSKEINLILYDVNIKGIIFDKVDAIMHLDGKYFEIKQVIAQAKDVSIVAQGGCDFISSDDYECKLNTSSKGLLPLLGKLEENKVFTSRGTYVAGLVLRSQTSQRIITPISFNPKGFYINNIIMTSQKNK